LAFGFQRYSVFVTACGVIAGHDETPPATENKICGVIGIGRDHLGREPLSLAGPRAVVDFGHAAAGTFARAG
jgi:hypothetical protein